jgi:rubredoxin
MPGRIRATDLPIEVRRKLLGRAIRPAPASKARPRPEADDLAARWCCHNCGAVFTRWAAAQRHGNTPGHRRIILDLGDNW